MNFAENTNTAHSLYGQRSLDVATQLFRGWRWNKPRPGFPSIRQSCLRLDSGRKLTSPESNQSRWTTGSDVGAGGEQRGGKMSWWYKPLPPIYKYNIAHKEEVNVPSTEKNNPLWAIEPIEDVLPRDNYNNKTLRQGDCSPRSCCQLWRCLSHLAACTHTHTRRAWTGCREGRLALCVLHLFDIFTTYRINTT